MKRLAVMTMKGGTGKTTTAVSLSHGLSLAGKRVLLVDCDPQRSISTNFGVRAQRGLADLLMTGEVEILQVRDNLFVIDSGGRRLSETEISLGTRLDRERRLASALRNLKGCDYVICDCSPSLSLINMNALYYCDEVIIPVSMDHFALTGAEETAKIVSELQSLNSRCAASYWILPTFYDSRTRLAHRMLEDLRKKFGDRLLSTVIRTNQAIREAPGEHKTIFEHAPLSRGALDYYHLTEEILELHDSNENSLDRASS